MLWVKEISVVKYILKEVLLKIFEHDFNLAQVKKCSKQVYIKTYSQVKGENQVKFQFIIIKLADIS